MNKIIITLKNISIVEIALSLLLVYLYMLGAESFIPDGINKVFILRLQKGILYIGIVALFLLAISSFLFYRIKNYKFRNLEKNKISDFFLILLPLTPIVQYLLLNQDTLSSFGIKYIFLNSFLFSSVIIISIPVILSLLISRIWTLSLSLALLFLFLYMPILALDNSWYDEGSFKIQMLIFLVVSIGSFVLYKFNDFYLKLIIIIFFISNTIFVMISASTKNFSNYKTDNKVSNILNKINLKSKPDIYLLTYDSYVGNETMLQYGIDNSEQEKYLNKNGFKLYPNTYSIAGATISTMTRVLDLSDVCLSNKQAFAGKSNVHNFLRQKGYILGGVMLAEDFWEKKKTVLDYFYPKLLDNGHKIIIKSILKGEFDFDAPAQFAPRDQQQFIKAKRSFMNLDKHPKFLYTHSGPSHSQNSGKCRPNETALFKKRLIIANKEMKEDVETIQKNNPNAIIIINGDHGPYLTGTCTYLSQKEKVSRLDIQDRFGTFLAIKWPKYINPIDGEIKIIQDLFPSIIATLADKNKILEEIKISRKTANVERGRTAGAYIDNGVIVGGINDGEPLFLGKQ
jgi:hypothetical protein